MLIGSWSARLTRIIGQTQLSVPVSVLRQRTIFCKTHVRYTSTKKPQTTLRSLQQAKNTDFNAKGYILLVIPITAFVLGTWQVQRRKWKLHVIEELEKRTTAVPVPLPLDLQEVEDLEYSRVVVRGHFDHSRELHIMPRAPVPGSQPDAGSEADRIIQRGIIKTGANVITAFVVDSPEHPNMRILVNRGWVPRDKLNPSTRQAGQIEGTINLTGIVRLNEKRGQFSPANNPVDNQWFSRDIDAMSQVLGTEPVFLDADRKSTVPGGPYGGQTIVTLRNEHMQYIITWYSLAAITFLMWAKAYMVK